MKKPLTQRARGLMQSGLSIIVQRCTDRQRVLSALIVGITFYLVVSGVQNA